MSRIKFLQAFKWWVEIKRAKALKRLLDKYGQLASEKRFELVRLAVPESAGAWEFVIPESDCLEFEKLGFKKLFGLKLKPA